MCYLDLDQFKVVNDTAGHKAGDALLTELAAHLTRHVRDRDSLARLGGDSLACCSTIARWPLQALGVDEAQGFALGEPDDIANIVCENVAT